MFLDIFILYYNNGHSSCYIEACNPRHKDGNLWFQDRLISISVYLTIGFLIMFYSIISKSVSK